MISLPISLCNSPFVCPINPLPDMSDSALFIGSGGGVKLNVLYVCLGLLFALLKLRGGFLLFGRDDWISFVTLLILPILLGTIDESSWWLSFSSMSTSISEFTVCKFIGHENFWKSISRSNAWLGIEKSLCLLVSQDSSSLSSWVCWDT